MIKAGFIGAGKRAKSGHYPSVYNNPDVSIEAVSELDPESWVLINISSGLPNSTISAPLNPYSDKVFLSELSSTSVLNCTWATVPPVKSIESNGPDFIIKDAMPEIISANDSKLVNFCLLIKLKLVFDNNRKLNTQTFKRFTHIE